MAEKNPFRVYFGPHDSHPATLFESQPAAQQVQISLGELLDNCADASRAKRAWVQDFHDERVTISTDLYEVILAYQHYRRTSA